MTSSRRALTFVAHHKAWLGGCSTTRLVNERVQQARRRCTALGKVRCARSVRTKVATRYTPHGGVYVSKQLWADVWLMATRTLHVLEGLWSV